jgi:outer membrane lipoprotein carrier protein
VRAAVLAALLSSSALAAGKKAPPAAPKLDPGQPFPAYAASTAPITVELIARRFAEVDARVTTMRARFAQSVRVEGSDTVQTVEGEVLFKKPDLLRLTHTVPEKQVVVSDGKSLWVWRESTNQVIQTPLDKWRSSEPLAKGLLDFGRTADLLTRYDAKVSTVSTPGPDGHRTFELLLTTKPADRKDGDAEFLLTLVASTRDFFPGESKLVVGRASIRSRFTDARLNPELPPETFQFTPPPGADLFKTPEK